MNINVIIDALNTIFNLRSSSGENVLLKDGTLRRGRLMIKYPMMKLMRHNKTNQKEVITICLSYGYSAIQPKKLKELFPVTIIWIRKLK